jgi:hypothetical protein
MGRFSAIPFFYAVISLGVWWETSESSVKSVCYNELGAGVSRKEVATNPCFWESYFLLVFPDTLVEDF